MIKIIRNGVEDWLYTPTTLANETLDQVAVSPTIISETFGTRAGLVIASPALRLSNCKVKNLYVSDALVQIIGDTYEGEGIYFSNNGSVEAYATQGLLSGGLNGKLGGLFSLAAGDATPQLWTIDRTATPGAAFGAITLTFGAVFVGGRYLHIKIAGGVGVWAEHWCHFIPEGMGSSASHPGGGPLDGAGLVIDASASYSEGIVLISGSTARVGGRNPDGGFLMRGGRTAVAANHGSNFQGVIDEHCSSIRIGAVANNSHICYETYPWTVGVPLSGSAHWDADASSSVVCPAAGLLAGGAPSSDPRVADLLSRVQQLEGNAPELHNAIAVKTDAAGRFQGPKKWTGRLWVDR